MRSKFKIIYEGSNERGRLTLECTLRQAQKAFIALAYAMTGSAWACIDLYLVTNKSVVRVNRATFNGAIFEDKKAVENEH